MSNIIPLNQTNPSLLESLCLPWKSLGLRGICERELEGLVQKRDFICYVQHDDNAPNCVSYSKTPPLDLTTWRKKWEAQDGKICAIYQRTPCPPLLENCSEWLRHQQINCNEEALSLCQTPFKWEKGADGNWHCPVIPENLSSELDAFQQKWVQPLSSSREQNVFLRALKGLCASGFPFC